MPDPLHIWLVGGTLRDQRLGGEPGDRDYAFAGSDEAFLHRFPNAYKVGKRFAVFLVGQTEFAKLRGKSIQDDLLARDFTINALAQPVDPNTLEPLGEIIPHPDALADLDAKILRPCSQQSLQDDPVRLFRAARFLATHPQFSPHPELIDLAQNQNLDAPLAEIEPERVGREYLKALAGPNPRRFLDLLAQTQRLDPWFAELEYAHDVPAGPKPWHDESVLEHTLQVMDRAQPYGPLVVHMALCHDLGKLHTDPQNLPHHYGHEHLGETPATTLAQRLKLPNAYIQAGPQAALEHMRAGRYAQLRPGTRVDLLSKLHAKHLLAETFQLVAADAGLDLLPKAAADLERILSVKLPPEKQNLGPLSAQTLRDLRCRALAAGARGEEAGRRPAPRRGAAPDPGRGK